MKPFRSPREAKEFVISRIVDEAQRENAPLSEAERRMLYFSEQHDTFRSKEVSGDFDGVHDQNEYEEKIAHLIRNTDRRARKEAREVYDIWVSAIGLIRTQDHYLGVMIDRAGLRPPGDLLKLVGTGIVITALLLGTISVAVFVSDHYCPAKISEGHPNPLKISTITHGRSENDFN